MNERLSWPRRICMAAAMLCVLPALSALPATSGDLERRVDRVFAAYAGPDRPGCAVGLFDHGRTVLAKGYGMADLAWRAPIDADTAFELGSATKQFTALAILMLEADGKLSRQDPVRKFLPGVPAPYDGVTLDHLIRHTSGIPDYIHLAHIAQSPGLPALTHDNALALAFSVPPLYAPGDDFAYSNTGYLLLADVVAAASGTSYASFVDTRIFKPLGMRATVALDPSRPSRARATVYEMDGKAARDALWRGRDAPGAWGVRSTLRDLARYHAALTDKSSWLAPYLARMEAPAQLNDGEPVRYGAGLYVGSYRGLRTVRHSGWAHIDFLRFPQSGRAVAVLCNRTDADAEMLSESVADVFLGAALGPAGAEPAATRGHALAGDYVAASGERMRIADHGGHLELDGWGPLRDAEAGTLTAGPATDRLRITPLEEGGQRRLRVSFQSNRTLVFDAYTPAALGPDAQRALAGLYRNDALRSSYAVEIDGGGLVLVPPDRSRIALESVTADLFAAGSWRVRVRRSPAGVVEAIEIATDRTPQLVFGRVRAATN